MSTFTIKVSKVDKIEKHPNADALEILSTLGWDTVVPKGVFQTGELCVMIPYNTLLTKESAEKLGVTKYLKGSEHNRVGHINLRGCKSYGIVTKPLDHQWIEGDEVAEFYGATKYEPPIKGPKFGGTHTKRAYDDPRFSRYTDIENIKNYPDILKEGEEVWISEKIHGTSARLAYIDGKVMCGSRKHQRKPPGFDQDEYGKNIPFFQRILNRVKYFFWSKFNKKINTELCKLNWWWFPYSIDGVRTLLHEEGPKYKSLAIYGETYGNVQYLTYNVEATEKNPKGLAFAAYDIRIDDRWLNYEEFINLCQKYNIPTVPVLYKGTFNFDNSKKLAEEDSKIGSHIAEGVVIKPIEERHDPRYGRVVLKLISNKYLDSEAFEHDTTDN